MTGPLIRKVARRKPLPKELAKPDDFLEFTSDVVAVVDEATRGGRLIQKLDRFVDDWILRAKLLAGKSSIVARVFPVGRGPQVHALARPQRGRFLPKLEGGEAFELTAETRRTGGVLEARGIKHDDGSAIIELGGYVLDPRQAFPGGAVLFREARSSNDFSNRVRSASEKSIGTILLTRRNPTTGQLKTYQVLHLWGFHFGDEARDGLMYGPEEFNQFWQNKGVEQWIRQCGEFANRQGGNLVLRARARSYSPRLLKEMELKSLKEAKEAGLDPGTLVRKRINQSANEHVLKEVVYELMIETIDEPGVFKPFHRLEFEIPPPWEKDSPIKLPFDPALAHLEPLPS
jgi:hypothetical protein